MTLKRIQYIAMITVLLMSFGGIASDGFPGSPLAGMTVYADDTEKIPVKALILPKFEIGEAEGDFPGEAQLFYEHYCAGCKELDIPNTTPTAEFYFNEDNGVGLLVTGSGKTAAGLSLMSLLSFDAYDFSDTIIVSVGCAGGNTGTCIFGDVVLVTAACDLELGYHTGSGELADPVHELTWFPSNDSFGDYSCKLLNAELCDEVYQLIKDCPLRTTENTRRVLADNFPDKEWADREPQVMRGTAVTADSYWKGMEDHANAAAAAYYYDCPDSYAVTEMEEIAVMNTAHCFDMQDRVISLRVVVNLDTFLKGESPAELWAADTEDTGFGDKVSEDNSETLDIFRPGMENLFDAGRIVIDAILAGELQASPSGAGLPTDSNGALPITGEMHGLPHI